MKEIPTKNLRLKLLLFILANICAAWYLGKIEFDQWFNAVVWFFAIFTASEGVSKGAHAYMNKGQE